MSTAQKSTDNPADNEIIISRVLHAPRELVWDAWTNPKHVVNWWGPRGFTNTLKRHEFRVGGYWEHTMHGPDGTNYPNKAKFLEIVPLESITFLLGGGSDLEDDERRGTTFRATWTFETVEGNKTRLTGRMVFPSKEARDRVVRDFGAIEGGKQTLQRAAEYTAGLLTKPFVISREFAAPRDLVWRAWTECEHFKQWFGPKGFTTDQMTMDLRPGGMTHYRMSAPDGTVIWGRAVYREIVPPSKLIWINSFSDKDRGITSHPLSSDPWPREILTVVTLAENAGSTTVTISSTPFDATEAERDTFEKGRGSMTMGWTGTLDRLAGILVPPL
jgi:uncharacterized protein YndB with AHSA1/START domain